MPPSSLPAPLSPARIFLYAKNVDMRKRFDGLHAIVQAELQRDIRLGDLFLFLSRRLDRIKLIHGDGDGLVMTTTITAQTATMESQRKQLEELGVEMEKVRKSLSQFVNGQRSEKRILPHSDQAFLPFANSEEFHAARAEAEAPYNIFDFRVSRHRDGPDEFFRDSRCVVQGDCFSGNTSVVIESDERLTLAACWGARSWSPRRTRPRGTACAS